MLKYPHPTFSDIVKPFMANRNGQVQEYSDNDSEIPYMFVPRKYFTTMPIFKYDNCEYIPVGANTYQKI